MIIILGLMILIAAVITGAAGVLSNTGSGHALSHPFTMFGYHVAGSADRLFGYGLAVGALAMLGLSLLLAGAWRASRRGQHARQDSGNPAPRPPPSRATGATCPASATPPDLTRLLRSPMAGRAGNPDSGPDLPGWSRTV